MRRAQPSTLSDRFLRRSVSPETEVVCAKRCSAAVELRTPAPAPPASHVRILARVTRLCSVVHVGLGAIAGRMIEFAEQPGAEVLNVCSHPSKVRCVFCAKVVSYAACC